MSPNLGRERSHADRPAERVTTDTLSGLGPRQRLEGYLLSPDGGSEALKSS